MRRIDPIEKPCTHRQADQGGNQKTGQAMQTRLHALARKPQTLHAACHAHGSDDRNGLLHGHHLQPDAQTHQSGSETRKTVDVAAQSGAGSQIEQKFKRDVFHGESPPIQKPKIAAQLQRSSFSGQ